MNPRIAPEICGRIRDRSAGSDGQAAVDAAVALEPDLALLDISMPRMSASPRTAY